MNLAFIGTGNSGGPERCVIRFLQDRGVTVMTVAVVDHCFKQGYRGTEMYAIVDRATRAIAAELPSRRARQFATVEEYVENVKASGVVPDLVMTFTKYDTDLLQPMQLAATELVLVNPGIGVFRAVNHSPAVGNWHLPL